MALIDLTRARRGLSPMELGLLAFSVAMIVVHNHPRGDPTPSPRDAAMTREIVAAGKLLDIEVLDHLVFGHQARRAVRRALSPTAAWRWQSGRNALE